MKIIILLAITAILNSCAFHVNPDGSKDVTIDAKTAAAALRVIAEK